MKPIDLGERVIVQGMTHFVTRVKDVVWVSSEGRWCIILDWGEHGTSKVYDTDEGKVWYRYASMN